MENIRFIFQMVIIVAGLVLMGATLIQMKRQGGFDQAMKLTPDGKWPVTRKLFGSCLFCFGVALFIAFWFE